jgi:hypothetical protein
MYNNAILSVVDVITPLAPESLKSCTVKNPKIKDIKSEVDNVEDVEDEFLFKIIVEIGATRERQIEYLIYDTLSLVGTVGGTLGLFVGFSFYDFIFMIIDLKRFHVLLFSIKDSIFPIHMIGKFCYKQE